MEASEAGGKPPKPNTLPLYTHTAARLGELNASCVGFTTHLELAEEVADAVVAVVTSAKAPRVVTRDTVTSDTMDDASDQQVTMRQAPTAAVLA